MHFSWGFWGFLTFHMIGLHINRKGKLIAFMGRACKMESRQLKQEVMESRLDTVCFNFLLLLLPLGVNIGRGSVMEPNYIPTICIIIIFCLYEIRYKRKTGIYHYCWDNWSSPAPWAKSRKRWSALNIINYGMTSLISQTIWIGIFRHVIHLAWIPMTFP